MKFRFISTDSSASSPPKINEKKFADYVADELNKVRAGVLRKMNSKKAAAKKDGTIEMDSNVSEDAMKGVMEDAAEKFINRAIELGKDYRGGN